MQDYFGNRKEEAKDQASRTKGWLGDKADEAQHGDPSNDLGAAFRDAKDSVKSGANYVRDRCALGLDRKASGLWACWQACQALICCAGFRCTDLESFGALMPRHGLYAHLCSTEQ